MSKLKRAITFAVSVGTGSALYCGFILYSLRSDPDGFDSTYQVLKLQANVFLLFIDIFPCLFFSV